MAKILIIDDSQYMRLMIRRILTENGHKVIDEIKHIDEAIGKYQRLNPDLVIIDIGLPELRGLEVIRNIVAIDSNARIIVVSALSQHTIALEVAKAGAKNFITKPFKPYYIKTSLNHTI